MDRLDKCDLAILRYANDLREEECFSTTTLLEATNDLTDTHLFNNVYTTVRINNSLDNLRSLGFIQLNNSSSRIPQYFLRRSSDFWIFLPDLYSDKGELKQSWSFPAAPVGKKKKRVDKKSTSKNIIPENSRQEISDDSDSSCNINSEPVRKKVRSSPIQVIKDKRNNSKNDNSCIEKWLTTAKEAGNIIIYNYI
jgi:hypothetical protein